MPKRVRTYEEYRDLPSWSSLRGPFENSIFYNFEMFGFFIALGLICLVVPFTVLIGAGYVHEDAVSSMRYVWFFFALATIVWKFPVKLPHLLSPWLRLFKVSAYIWVGFFVVTHYFPEKYSLDPTTIPRFLIPFVEQYGSEFLFLIALELHIMAYSWIAFRSGAIQFMIVYDIGLTFLFVFSNNLFIRDFPPPEAALWIMGFSSTASLFNIKNPAS